MFFSYFNLKENPFNLIIDLTYLYLGRQHEEAIAHLTYAVSEGEGFIVITGQRGAGKTIVCRSFLEGLNANVESAYIDRYTSNPQKLLMNINTEFNIHSDTTSIKDLADTLNEFLMQKKLQDKKVVVFIDDAHELDADVLEQVRLISNLETSKDKLLQLVLIGEPKLSQMLNSNELRQIGQRVSVGYFIGPLNYDETLGYIQHRLTIASKGPPIRFDQKAVRRIFKYSNGIPRKINLACSHALDVAYKRQLKYINSDVAREAVGYLSERTKKAEPKSRRRWLLGTIAVASCLFLSIIIAVLFIKYSYQQDPSNEVFSDTSSMSPGADMQLSEMLTPPSLDVNPEPPIPKDDAVAEPFQPDPSGIPVENYDPPHHIANIDEPSSLKMVHSVQVGAFRGIENAEKLVARLGTKGYSARIVKTPDTQGRSWYMVLIGDHPTLEAAEKQARAFTESENMKTFIRPYKAF